MPKFIIYLKKIFYVKPKWRILRVFTKIITRSSLEKIKRQLEDDVSRSKEWEERAFLQWQLETIKYFLK